MGKFTDWIGTMATFFQFGLQGNAIKNDTNGLEVRNAADTASANLIVASPTLDVHASTYLDVKQRTLLIEFSFDGAAPPAGGANTGSYGFCHTSGGSYTQGQVVYDNGTSLDLIDIYKMHCINTNSTAITGAISLIANGTYQAEASTAPYSWTLKGDGTVSNVGALRLVRIPIALAATTDSTTSIPANATVMEVQTNVTSVYSAGTTIAVAVNGSTPLSIQDATKNNPEATHTYVTQDLLPVASANAGVVRVTITGSPAAGAGEVIVSYAEAYLA